MTIDELGGVTMGLLAMLAGFAMGWIAGDYHGYSTAIKELLAKDQP